MEIERKWMVNGWPETGLKLLYVETQKQGYLHPEPVIVRIREEKRKDAPPKYVLCFKSAGRLERMEVEVEITEKTFLELEKMTGCPLISKLRKTYQLQNLLKLEVNIVDEGLNTEFMYAEVEFESVAQAKSWNPDADGLSDYLSNEVTFLPGQSMADYWTKTRLEKEIPTAPVECSQI